MKKLLIFALAAAMVLMLSACGPKGDAENTLSTSDGSVTSADIPEETLPATADDSVTADNEPVTLPDEIAVGDESSETEASADNAVTTSSDAAKTSATTTTTTAATTTKASTTTAATTTATQKTTETAATTTTTADPDEGFEEEELEWEIIENLDEWLLSMGIETGGVNAND